MGIEEKFDDIEREHCSECREGEHKYIDKIQVYADDNGFPAYLITYTCGHQRSVPIIEY